jgi:predicted RNA binding protein YcfA (HicA-like mRNA interferase family)
MVTRDFSGREVVKVLYDHGYRLESRTGSHVTLTEVTDDGEFRRVTVPQKDSIPVGTLRDIAEQAGAKDFDEFCRWIDRNR